MDTNEDISKWSDILQSMELDGLKEMRKMLDRAIACYETRKRQETLCALEEAARQHGFKLTDVVSNGRPGKNQKSGTETPSVAARYVNPVETWTGRGGSMTRWKQGVRWMSLQHETKEGARLVPRSFFYLFLGADKLSGGMGSQAEGIVV